MSNAKNKYPIGIQDFEDLRMNDFLYIDKTDIIHQLVSEGKVYFLSRPRRFGKSLLVSTLQCLFEGRRELFNGLAIDQMDYDWTPHPVIRIDMNADNFRLGTEVLNAHIQKELDRNAQRLGVDIDQYGTLSGKLDSLIYNVVEKYGKQVAVLVDEYDKPLLETITDRELHSKMKDILKAFYGVLKSAGGQLHFTFLTGVTKFGQVSVFSDLNHLEDISQDKPYTSLLGITQHELEHYFERDIQAISISKELSYDSILKKIQSWYNGYHFEADTQSVYNPFSVMNFLKKGQFKNFWLQTGTPSFLLDILEHTDQNIPDLDGYISGENKLIDFSDPINKPIAALYQSGYLTIKSYNPKRRIYTLGYPNHEVKFSFIESLANRFTPEAIGQNMDFHIEKFSHEIETGDIDGFMERLQNLYSRLPYDHNEKKEKYYQTVFYLIFELMGQNIKTEVKTARGRSDAIIETDNYVYIVEMKLDGSVKDALSQIDEKGYADPYKYDARKIFKIGLAFDKDQRTIAEWSVDE